MERQLIDPDKIYGRAGLSPKQRSIRHIAVNSFEAFIRLVAPYQLLAHCHIDLCKWVELHNDVNRLLLWPRDHGKSRFSAFYAAWRVVRDPAITIIYASATAEKAEEQLRFVKTILSSKIAQRYFPGLLNEKEGQREEWNKKSFIVDHEWRKTHGVVDSTIMTAGIGKVITGKHCNLLILDDIVVPENNTEIGRRDVNAWVAQAASIMSADSCMFVVGTRYHPNDAYSVMMDMVAHHIEDESGEVIEEEPLFIKMQDDVEVDGDFLWPRVQNKEGRWFGFNKQILARKRAVYEAAGEITQFFAQYYNDPNDRSMAPISRDLFQYYDKGDLEHRFGLWTIQGRPVSVYAAVDLAASTHDRADYTVIIVGGIDDLGNRYVMHVDRYRTDKMSKTVTALVDAYKAYQFKKLRIEAVGGFKLVAQDLHDSIGRKGVRVPTDFYLPAQNEAKATRINHILEPLYQSGSVYHYRGGACQLLEDELVSANPAHDDLKDAWAMCCNLMQLPITRKRKTQNVLAFHPRFGGVVGVRA